MKPIEKLENLKKKKSPHYFCYFDETEFPDSKETIALMLLTDDKHRLRSVINNIKFRARREFPDIIKSSVLHFTDILSAGYEEFLIWALEEIAKKTDVVASFNIVDPKSYKGYSDYQIKQHRISNFVSTFLLLYQSGFAEENISFIFDKGFIPPPHIKKYFFIIHNFDKGNGSAEFTPQVDKFKQRIKDSIHNGQDFMVFTTEVSNVQLDPGIQAADFFLGALRQAIKGNSKYLDIIKEKFLEEGSVRTISGKQLRI